jgi:AcrR family transcriptional regulator
MPTRYHHGDLRNALIQAGTELLARDGIAGLSLRKAAKRAGVSHSAPYNHFPDKQALVAAISTHGLQVVRERMAAARKRGRDPYRQLVEAAWEIVRFGLEQPDLYQVTFGNAVEREEDYPAYVEEAHRGFDELVELVASCQAAGVIAPGPADVAATGLWSLVHGLVSLLRNRQLPRRLLERTPPRELLLQILRAQPRTAAAAKRGPGSRQKSGGR